jgi:hypothetical protein
MTRDRRPRWLLQKNARISQHRRAMHVGLADDIDFATWWRQIEESATALGLVAGAPGDWQPWTDGDDVGSGTDGEP